MSLYEINFQAFLFALFEEEMWDRRGSEERRRARALYHINSILKLHGLDLATFGLPAIDEAALHEDSEPLDVRFIKVARMLAGRPPHGGRRRGRSAREEREHGGHNERRAEGGLRHSHRVGTPRSIGAAQLLLPRGFSKHLINL